MFAPARLKILVLCAVFLLTASPVLYAADSDQDGVDDSVDIDRDGDQLIEIDSLADLDLMRQVPDGTSLNGNSTGCAGCNGYELVADLDFDTNDSGTADSGDTYWNGGRGWTPIGKNDPTVFRARFNGNGHRIYHLYQRQTEASDGDVGLFGVTNGASISNLKLVRVDVRGYERTGGLIGNAYGTDIEDVRVTGDVRVLNTSAGGVVGNASSASVLRRTFSAVYAQGYIAGTLVGSMQDSTVEDCLAAGRVFAQFLPSPPYYFEGQISGSVSNIILRRSYGRGRDAGLLASVSGSNTFTANYWDTFVTNVTSGPGGVALFPRELKCPLFPDNTTCKGGLTLYEGWSSDDWDFGTGSQYPELISGGVVQRDADGDNFMDSEDDFPNNRAAARDQDSDGLPDSWNMDCETACRDASGLTLDNDPADPAPTIVLDDPINVDEGTTLVLDASASFDPQGSITAIDWDLDLDGAFDDAVGTLVDLGVQPDDASFDIAIRISDNGGGASTATRTVNVLNVAPQTSVQLAEVTVNSSVEITLEATDVAADTITSYDIVTPPARGQLTGSGNIYTYEPNDGEDSSDSFTYTATDDDGGVSVEQTVLIAISRGASKPVFLVEDEETTLVGAGSGLLLVLLGGLGALRRRRA